MSIKIDENSTKELKQSMNKNTVEQNAVYNVQKIAFKRLTPTAKIFIKQSEYAACFDMYADVDELIAPYSTIVIPTNIATEIPIGYEGQVRGRSGLSSKGIIMANGVGTIDADYRGSIGVILYNTTNAYYKISKYDRIGQFLISRVIPIEFIEKEILSDTIRANKGFGSTGK